MKTRSKRQWKRVQRQLKARGFSPGQIDGVCGSATEAAIIAFKRSAGLKARAYLGPITEAALFKGIKLAPTRVQGCLTELPTWLRLAYGYLGLREIKGPRHNAEIMSWWQRLSLPFKDDETPWCAGFVNAMVQASGLPIVRKNRAAALSWRWNGYGTHINGPALGAIMSIERPGRRGSGHQTIVAGRDRHGNVMCLGGNQGDMVSINPYDPWARNAQYHFPAGARVPSAVGLNTLPFITSDDVHLTNEA